MELARKMEEENMGIEEEYRLSCYEELTEMGQKPKVHLVKEVTTGDIFIKKEIAEDVVPIYQRLRREKIKGIPQIHEIIENENQAFVIEDYIHGRSLEKILEQEGQMEVRETAEIVLDICKILRRLHEQKEPVIHRDIKPSNIMISSEGTLYVIDFDAARLYSREKRQDTQLLGTKRYAPPEQYGLGQTDARSDIYALGIMMNVMVTGEYPDERMADGEIGNVIGRCIPWEPKERYQTVRELEEDLKEILFPTNEKQKESLRGSSGEKTGILGFRSKVLWKMAAAVIGYLFLAFVCLRMDITNQNGVPLSGGQLWLERGFVLAIFLLNLLYLGNFAGLREKSFGKWRDSRWLSWLIAAAWVVGITFFCLICMMLTEAIIWGSV